MGKAPIYDKDRVYIGTGMGMYRDSKTLGLCVGTQALSGNEWRAVVHRKRVYGLGRFHPVQRWLQVLFFLCAFFKVYQNDNEIWNDLPPTSSQISAISGKSDWLNWDPHIG